VNCRINKSDLINYFEELYLRYKDNLFKNISNLTEHNFYILIDKEFDHVSKDNSNNICDIQFLNYLREISEKTNKNYFHFIFKFLFLVREFYNINKKDSVEEGKEFTMTSSAENMPDFCNDFIIEYMEPNDYYGLDTNELIEIIQHLCFWLYTNGYTSSRLTLL
jgi:hypothetical protein